MKKFILKSLLSISISIVIFISFYFISDYFLNKKDYDENSFYIWGDSQAYHGLNIETIKSTTKIKTYSGAKHGAGMYDFLFFASKVPEKSKVILAISKTIQLRRIDVDYHLSGLNFSALIDLFNKEYPLFIIKKTFVNNLKPKKFFSEDLIAFPCLDTLTIKEPLAIFKKIFSKTPTYLINKQNLYKRGIELLIAKKCKIIYIEFPYHESLQKIEKVSPTRKYTQNFKIELSKQYHISPFDTLIISKKINPMYDYTHLNVIGANLVSEKISDLIIKNKWNSFLIVELD